MGQQLGYERPPLVTSGDVTARGGFTTLGLTSPGFAMLQDQARSAGSTPVQTAAGPAFMGAPALGVGVLLLLLLAWYLDRRVLK